MSTTPDSSLPDIDNELMRMSDAYYNTSTIKEKQKNIKKMCSDIQGKLTKKLVYDFPSFTKNRLTLKKLLKLIKTKNNGDVRDFIDLFPHRIEEGVKNTDGHVFEALWILVFLFNYDNLLQSGEKRHFFKKLETLEQEERTLNEILNDTYVNESKKSGIADLFFEHKSNDEEDVLESEKKPKVEYLGQEITIPGCIGKITKNTNKKYLFSSKYFKKERSVAKYDIPEINLEANDKSLSDYNIVLLVKDKLNLEKKMNRTDKAIKRKFFKIMDLEHLDKFYKKLLADLKKTTIDKFIIKNQKDIVNPKEGLTLRFHQEYIVRYTDREINDNQEKKFVWGAVPRSGKSYMIAGLIKKRLAKTNQVIIFLGAKTETMSQFYKMFKNDLPEISESKFKIHKIEKGTDIDKIIPTDNNIILLSQEMGWVKSGATRRETLEKYDLVKLKKSKGEFKKNSEWVIDDTQTQVGGPTLYSIVRGDTDFLQVLETDIKKARGIQENFKKILDQNNKLIFFDEVHKGSSIAIAQRHLLKKFVFGPTDNLLEQKKSVFVMVTATFSKPMMRYGGKLIQWSYEDIQNMKDFGEEMKVRFLENIDNQLKKDVFSEIVDENIERGILYEELAQQYSKYPNLNVIYPTMVEPFIKVEGIPSKCEITRELICEKILACDKDKLSYPSFTTSFLKYIQKDIYENLLYKRFGYNVTAKTHSQLWFLPTPPGCGQKTTAKDGEGNRIEHMTRNLAKQMMKDPYFRKNYCVIVVHGQHTQPSFIKIIPEFTKQDREGGQIHTYNELKVTTYNNKNDPCVSTKCVKYKGEKSLGECIMKEEAYAKAKNKSVIILTGMKLRLGISLPCVDVALHMDPISNVDTIYQSMFRVLTERPPGKTDGYFIDLLHERTVKFFLDYNAMSTRNQYVSAKKKREMLLKNLFTFNINGINNQQIEDSEYKNIYSNLIQKLDIGNSKKFINKLYDSQKESLTKILRNTKVISFSEKLYKNLERLELLKKIVKQKNVEKRDLLERKAEADETTDAKKFTEKTKKEQKIAFEKIINHINDVFGLYILFEDFIDAPQSGGAAQKEINEIDETILLEIIKGGLTFSSDKNTKIKNAFKKYSEENALIYNGKDSLGIQASKINEHINTNSQSFAEINKYLVGDNASEYTQIPYYNSYTECGKHNFENFMEKIRYPLLVSEIKKICEENKYIIDCHFSYLNSLNLGDRVDADKNIEILNESRKLVVSFLEDIKHTAEFNEFLEFYCLLRDKFHNVKTNVKQFLPKCKGPKIEELPEDDGTATKQTGGTATKKSANNNMDENILSIIRQHLVIKDKEKKLFGEVFTPVELVCEMLEQLPKSVWTNPNLKWLDPANGIGNFPFVVYYKLMKGLEGWKPDNDERSKHIIEKMLYMVELNPVNCKVCKKIFKMIDSNANPNILKANFIEEFNITKKFSDGTIFFDIIMGNPPYNSRAGTGTGNTIWQLFTKQSLNEWLKKKGYLLFVHPPGWRKPNTNRGKYYGLYNLMGINNQMEYLSIHGLGDGRQIFKAGTRYDWYIIKKVPKYKDTEISDEKGKLVDINMSNFDWLPNYNINMVKKILAKKSDEKCPIIYNRSSYGSDNKKRISKIQTNEYKYPIVHTIPKTGTRYIYSSRNDKGHFGVSKVIFGQSNSENPIIDMTGKYGMSEHSMAISVKNVDEAKMLSECLKSKTFQTLIDSCSFSNYSIDWRLFTYFKKDFYKIILKKEEKLKSKSPQSSPPISQPTPTTTIHVRSSALSTIPKPKKIKLKIKKKIKKSPTLPCSQHNMRNCKKTGCVYKRGRTPKCQQTGGKSNIYTKIYDPVSKKNVSIFGQKGGNLIKRYLHQSNKI